MHATQEIMLGYVVTPGTDPNTLASYIATRLSLKTIKSDLLGISVSGPSWTAWHRHESARRSNVTSRIVKMERKLAKLRVDLGWSAKPKWFKPRPKTASDARIERQYAIHLPKHLVREAEGSHFTPWSPAPLPKVVVAETAQDAAPLPVVVVPDVTPDTLGVRWNRFQFGHAVAGETVEIRGRRLTFLGEFARKKEAGDFQTKSESSLGLPCQSAGYLNGRRQRGWIVYSESPIDGNGSRAMAA